MIQLQFGFRSRDCRRGSPKNKVTARQIVTTCNYLGCVVVSDLAKNAICTKMYYHFPIGYNVSNLHENNDNFYFERTHT